MRTVKEQPKRIPRKLKKEIIKHFGRMMYHALMKENNISIVWNMRAHYNESGWKYRVEPTAQWAMTIRMHGIGPMDGPELNSLIKTIKKTMSDKPTSLI
jgi:hypothetical protein